MRKRPIFIIAFLFSYIFSFANTGDMYLFFDKSCMDKFDYVISKKEVSGLNKTNFTAYHIRINDSEKVILNVDAQGKTMSSRPAGTKFCGEVLVSENFARKINTKKTKVKLVAKTNSGFVVYPVVSADYFFTTDTEMGYATKDYTFAYNYTTNDEKKDLATKDSKGNVYFKERNDDFCPSKYKFRRTPAKNYDPYTDFILVPDVGLVEKRTGVDVAQANSNVLTLKNVNGIPLDQYMDAVCNGYVKYLSKDEAKTDVVTTNTSPSNTGTSTTTVTDLESGGHTTTHSSGTSIVHHSSTDVCHHLYKDVTKGFYYNRNTGALANETCGGITYNQGMMITGTRPVTTPPVRTQVAPPVTRDTRVVYRDRAPETKIVYRDAPPKVVYRDGPERVVYKDRVVYRDRPQDEFTSKGTNSTSTVTGTSSTAVSSEFHTVQAKETLYAISKKYRVGVAELKRWNGLKTNTISIGQVLRIRGQELVSKGGTTTSSNYGATSELRLGDTVPGTRKVIGTEKDGYETYSDYHIVRAKETLYSIAKRYGMNVDRLKAINKLKTNTLSIGQRLSLVETQPTSYSVPSTTKKVEIPTSYDVVAQPKAEELVPPKAEPIPPKEELTSKGAATSTAATAVTTTTTLDKNQLIGRSSTSVVKSTDPLSEYNASGQMIHIVGDNETLFTIAKWYGTTVTKLRALNNFDKNEVILPKQKIKIK